MQPERFTIDIHERERGAALLTVLLLVAVMAVMAATMLDRLTLSTRLAGNGSAMAQARSYSYAAETIAMARLEDMLSHDAAQTTLQGDWLARDIPIPVDGGQALARINDQDNCFNLNSLASGDADGKLFSSPTAVRQFAALMTTLGIGSNDAITIAESTSDWIDSDESQQTSGAEDGYYRGLPTPYLAANRMMADRSELRSVRGMTPVYYQKLRGWVCALPIAQPTKLNANTLLPDQAPLVVMLLEGRLSPAAAKAVLAKRPAGGYGSLNRFWADPQLAAAQPDEQIQGQVKLTSNWFQLESRITVGDIELESRSLLTAENGNLRVLSRSLGDAL